MAGEMPGIKGIDGLHRAKQWLEASTRVAYSWTVKDEGLSEMLEFNWPCGRGKTFSLDLGGKLRGPGFEGDLFIAEVKNYKAEYDLPAHFQAFLAKCYVAFEAKPKRCSHMMWISWSPFQARTWHMHSSTDNIRAAIVEKRDLVLGTSDEDEARQLIKEDVVHEVSRRLWLITLCEKQEQLVISDEHLGELLKYMRSGEASQS